MRAVAAYVTAVAKEGPEAPESNRSSTAGRRAHGPMIDRRAAD